MNSFNFLDKDSLPTIIFGFDEHWEEQNWYESVTKEVIYGMRGGNKWGLGDIPEEVQGIIANENSQEEAQKKIKKVFLEFISKPKNVQLRTEIIERANLRWNKVRKEYFKNLSSLLDIPVSDFEQTYYAYFTYSKRCPFSKAGFMFNRFNDFSNSAAHEIMHIEFLKKYTEQCKKRGMSDNQIQHLKEILTVLLNEDMISILYNPDYGYEYHKDIRQEVFKKYRIHKETSGNFKDFLDQAIELVKKQFTMQ